MKMHKLPFVALLLSFFLLFPSIVLSDEPEPGKIKEFEKQLQDTTRPPTFVEHEHRYNDNEAAIETAGKPGYHSFKAPQRSD